MEEASQITAGPSNHEDAPSLRKERSLLHKNRRQISALYPQFFVNKIGAMLPCKELALI